MKQPLPLHSTNPKAAFWAQRRFSFAAALFHHHKAGAWVQSQHLTLPRAYCILSENASAFIKTLPLPKFPRSHPTTNALLTTF